MGDPALTPELALDYLGEISTDIEAVVLLERSGRLTVASEQEPGRAEQMRELAAELFTRADLAAGGDGEAEQVEVALPGASVFGARRGRFQIVVVASRYALPSLMFYDLRSVLQDLERPAA